MKLLTLLALSVLFAGCAQINSLSVDEDDNAMACIKASGGFAGIFGGSGVTVEVSSKVDTSDWSAEDWRTLAEICD